MNFKKNSVTWQLTILCLVIFISFTGCDDDDASNINPGEVTLQTNSTLGDILVDGEGKTLYVFTRDVNGESNCTGGCLTNWPVYYAPNLQPGEGINADDFGTITRDDGTMQTTYKGWPLYYFVNDAAAGDVKGEAVNNVWFVAKPNYSLMLASAQLVGNDGKNYTGAYAEGDGETEYLIDASGRTLYRFTKDYNNVNKFTKSDFSNDGAWPVFHTDIDALPSILNEADFGTIDVFGRPQLTFKGHPLYYFGSDAAAGETKGVSVPTPGVWPVVNTQTGTAPEQPTVMVAANATLGNILTDNTGRTLYFFANDTKGTSTCAGSCLTNWPLFSVDEIVLPAGDLLNESDFGSIGDGATKQTTYKGRPLYYYTPGGTAEAAGAITGDGAGSVWFAAKPDYSLMVANAQLVGNDGKNYTSAYAEGTGMTRYFTDAAGRTLYIFTNDSNETNTFTAADLSNNSSWPIFHTEITNLPTIPLLTMDDFGTITVHGQSQLTYKGWPLYYFGGDAAKGDNKGVSVPVPGKWPVINENTDEAPL